ncbi:MAG: hypothetical protein JSU72_17735 [Deltaproteobacteria bacterium]|nr:MAG: hypothetical protein JSU72_17735 [Deltaproteobacteria bacterium]
MSKYTIQRFTPDLHGQVCQLQKHLWGSPTKLNPAYLDWKHLRNPYIPEPLIYLALYEGHVVGMRAMFGACWEAGEYTDKSMLPCAADTVIEPDYRDRGLFQELSDYVMDDLRRQNYRQILNFSSSHANYVVSVLTMGWRPMGSSEALIRAVPSISTLIKMIELTSRFKIASKVQAVSRKAIRKARVAARINAFAHLDRNANVQGHPVKLSREPKPEMMADLIQRLGGDGRIRHVRDQTYFSWRFGNPRASYRFLYWGDRDLDGYMILQNTVGDPRINIVDWEGASLEIRASLLEAAVAWGHFGIVCTWGTTLFASVIEILQQAGFTADNITTDAPNRSGQFMLKELGTNETSGTLGGRQLLDHGHWDLRMIYSDGV